MTDPARRPRTSRDAARRSDTRGRMVSLSGLLCVHESFNVCASGDPFAAGDGRSRTIPPGLDSASRRRIRARTTAETRQPQRGFGAPPRLSPPNIMTDGRSITRGLDWANAAIGDPRADVACRMAPFRLAPIPGVLEGVVAWLLPAAWLRGYRERRPPNALENLDPFCVWAGRMTERDLRPKLGRPGVWLAERDVGRVRRWTTACRQRMSGTLPPRS